MGNSSKNILHQEIHHHCYCTQRQLNPHGGLFKGGCLFVKNDFWGGGLLEGQGGGF